MINTFPSFPRPRSMGILALVAALAFPLAPAAAGLTDHVDTEFPGGHSVFRGANVPFGMMMFGPPGEGNPYGFSFMTLSGAHMGHQDVQIHPISGSFESLMAGSKDKAPSYKGVHSSRPGHFRSRTRLGVFAELSATTRAGIGRFAFPKGKEASVLIYPGFIKDQTHTEAAVVLDREVTGLCQKGGNPFHFVVRFSRPFRRADAVAGSTVTSGVKSVTGKNQGFKLEFDVAGGDSTVLMKVGLSFVSLANARANLDAEIPGWDLEKVAEAANLAWEEALSAIKVEGGTDKEKRAFYSAMYRSFFHPNVGNDVNGEYLGFDKKPHKAEGFTYYQTWSGWDIYRSQIPFIAWLFPQKVSHMMRSMVLSAQQGGGALPTWAVASQNTPTMGGDPSCAILASAFAFGARDFDTKAALDAMVYGATVPEAKNGSVRVRGKTTAFHLAKGYVPYSASLTLEYANADFSISRMAAFRGDTATSRLFLRRAQNWKNVFNPGTRYMQTRNEDGAWVSGGFTEGHTQQYTWMVHFNHGSLFEKIGGNAAVNARLDTFFTQLYGEEDPGPYCGLGNEPSFGAPWLYNWAGTPWKTQALLRRAMTGMFLEKLPGDDDLGSMSAWMVYVMLGIYPSISGVDGFSLGSPNFPKATIRMGDGRLLEIIGENAALDAPYVQSATLNGKNFTSLWLDRAALDKPVNTLRFVLGKTPNTGWGVGPKDAPPSFDADAAVYTPVSLAPKARAVPVPAPGMKAGRDAQGRLIRAESGRTLLRRFPEGVKGK